MKLGLVAGVNVYATLGVSSLDTRTAQVSAFLLMGIVFISTTYPLCVDS